MARYELLSTNEEVVAGPIEKIDVAKLQDLAIQKMVSFLTQNGRAKKGSIKVTRFDRKFSVVRENAEGLFVEQSYTPYIAKDGSVRCKGVGSAKVSKEAPQSE